MLMALTSRLHRLLFAIALALPLAAAAQSADKPFTNEQLDQMLAQVALYPDALLSQLMMAATYPDEFQEAVKWSKAHPDAKGDAAVKQVEGNDWDPSVASMVAFPEVLITLGDKPDYVSNLGDAFLAQPEDVMDSVQRLRAAAQKSGNLASNEQIKVSSQPAPPAAPAPASTTVVVQQPAPQQQVIVIEPAQPSVVFVPAYNPAVVYGPWWYPSYPPFYYPPPPGYWFSRTVATGLAWGVGIGISNALWGGFDWGRRDVNINVNRYNNINVNNRIDVNNNRTSWNHDPGHRKADYRGGNAQRQNLERKSAAGGRDPYRGKDASRDASRDRAQQAMADRGVDAGSGSARERAQNVDREAAQKKAQNVDRDAARDKAKNVDRDAARDKAKNVDRDAARQKAQNADRDAARQRAQQASQDSALKGAGDRQAKQQIDRGAASQKAAQQRPSGAHAAAKPSRLPPETGCRRKTGCAPHEPLQPPGPQAAHGPAAPVPPRLLRAAAHAADRTGDTTCRPRPSLSARSLRHSVPCWLQARSR